MTYHQKYCTCQLFNLAVLVSSTIPERKIAHRAFVRRNTHTSLTNVRWLLIPTTPYVKTPGTPSFNVHVHSFCIQQPPQSKTVDEHSKATHPQRACGRRPETCESICGSADVRQCARPTRRGRQQQERRRSHDGKHVARAIFSRHRRNCGSVECARFASEMCHAHKCDARCACFF